MSNPDRQQPDDAAASRRNVLFGGFAAAKARHAAKLIRAATLKIYPGAPHGLTVTHADQFNADLLAFSTGLR